MTEFSLTSKATIKPSSQPSKNLSPFSVNARSQHTPDYLQPDEYCNFTTPIAILLSALTMVILFYITINWSTLLFHTPVNHQLNLIVETSFVILCTIATWKHSRK